MRHMDYDEFKKEYKTYMENDMWNFNQEEDSIEPEGVSRLTDFLERRNKVVSLSKNYTSPNDMVNSPAHYTRGSQEVIDIIEQAISDAPSNTEGYLQGQALKYLLRVWLKDNPKQDCEKAMWYMNRLIDKLD